MIPMLAWTHAAAVAQLLRAQGFPVEVRSRLVVALSLDRTRQAAQEIGTPELGFPAETIAAVIVRRLAAPSP